MIDAMRVAIAWLALSGCQLVFQPEDPCAFSEAIPLTGLTHPTLKAPILDDDTLWFIAEMPVEKIRFATLGADNAIGPPTEAMFTAELTKEDDFAMSGDGLRLVLVTEARTIFELTRPDRDSPFGARKVITLNAIVESLDLSFDGLTMIFQDQNELLNAATRPSLIAAFDTIVPILDASGAQVAGKVPSLSRDGLELFFERSDSIRRRTRPSLEQPFSLAEDVIRFGDDPDLTNDDLTLLFLPEEKDHFELMRRECR